MYIKVLLPISRLIDRRLVPGVDAAGGNWLSCEGMMTTL